jgi:uncharacterized membrane protein
MRPPRIKEHDADGPSMTQAISILLIVGVVLSALLLLAGLALLVITGQTGYTQTTSLDALLDLGKDAFPQTIGGVLSGALALKPFAIIELGALMLIATPVFRVAASALLFALEDDRLYAGITLVVLVLLMASIFWIR